MTDRINGFMVFLENDIREDDVEPVLNAIRQIKGVIIVEPQVQKVFSEICTERRVIHEVSIKISNLLDELNSKK